MLEVKNVVKVAAMEKEDDKTKIRRRNLPSFSLSLLASCLYTNTSFDSSDFLFLRSVR